MFKHEEKYCPRCSSRFECKAGDINNCQCTKVKISENTIRFLEDTYYQDCLCSNCMVEIDHMVTFSFNHSMAKQKELLIDGLHYYTENGNIVFTELYHVMKGYCCKNNCRHCAYGFKKPK